MKKYIVVILSAILCYGGVTQAQSKKGAVANTPSAGTSLQGYRPVYEFTNPALVANWGWTNQGDATATDLTGGGIQMVAQAAGSDNLRILEVNTPSTPYTITIAFYFTPTTWGSTSLFGFSLRDSSGGKVVTAYYGIQGGTTRYVYDYWNSATSYGSNGLQTSPVMIGPTLMWMQMSDNGTNRIWRVGWDGVNYTALKSEANTTHMTPDKIGFVQLNSNGASAPSYMRLLHWKQT